MMPMSNDRLGNLPTDLYHLVTNALDIDSQLRLAQTNQERAKKLPALCVRKLERWILSTESNYRRQTPNLRFMNKLVSPTKKNYKIMKQIEKVFRVLHAKENKEFEGLVEFRRIVGAIPRLKLHAEIQASRAEDLLNEFGPQGLPKSYETMLLQNIDRSEYVINTADDLQSLFQIL